MSSNPEVMLSCVHLFSLLGERSRSRHYDRLFVEKMRESLDPGRVDSSRRSG